MSQAYVRDLTGSKAEQGIDAMLDELPGMLSSATSAYLKLIRRAGRAVGELLPADVLAGANECCTVPTQDCPPHCVAEICWEACPGETQRATITVKNTSHRRARSPSRPATSARRKSRSRRQRPRSLPGSR